MIFLTGTLTYLAVGVVLARLGFLADRKHRAEWGRSTALQIVLFWPACVGFIVVEILYRLHRPLLKLLDWIISPPKEDR